TVDVHVSVCLPGRDFEQVEGMTEVESNRLNFLRPPACLSSQRRTGDRPVRGFGAPRGASPEGRSRLPDAEARTRKAPGPQDPGASSARRRYLRAPVLPKMDLSLATKPGFGEGFWASSSACSAAGSSIRSISGSRSTLGASAWVGTTFS